MSVLRKLRFYPVTILLKPEPVLLFGETAVKKSNYKGSQIQLLSFSFFFIYYCKSRKYQTDRYNKLERETDNTAEVTA